MLIPILIPILRNTIFLRRYRADVSNYTAIDGLAIFDIAVIGFCACWLYENRWQVPWKRLWHGTIKCWFSYYMFAFVTILWRIRGSSALYICYRAGTMLILSAYIYMIFMKFRTALSAFRGLLNFSAALTLLLLIGNIRSGTLHTNTYSVCAAVTACLSLCAYRTNLLPLSKMKYYIFGGLFCLLLGTSSASNVSFACALIFIFSFDRNNRFHISFFLLTIISLAAAYYFGKRIIFKILFPHKSVRNVTSISGRLYLWSGYIDIWLQRPLQGWGFAVGERAGKSFGFMYALSAHNGYISILINTGLIGLSFWLVLFKRLIKSLLVQIFFESPYASAIASAFIVIAINNNSVPIIGSNWGPLSTLAFCVLAFWNIWCENAPKGFYHQPSNDQSTC
ncbi:MAG: O-antigen ligase family protein [Victivallales bacterium]|nr:O-antigen ligase family protein [Victivallales bacterium]